MGIEIETVDALRAQAAAGALSGSVIQGLDLTAADDALAGSLAGVVFLGCKLAPATLARAHEQGAVVFPLPEGLPYAPYRPRLYRPDELMEGYRRGDVGSFARDTLDARIYAHYEAARKAGAKVAVLEALAQRLHDHAIDDALADFLGHGEQAKRVVAIMGGHAMLRDEPAYREVARIAQRLAKAGYLLASGGGPGAMEATHLGAWLGDEDDAAIDDAIATLSGAPSYEDAAWFDTALEVRDRYPEGRESLGVPTWFYGHEPSNLFSTHLAKYFSNSLREDGLLAIATGGVVYAPGSAGTIQEVFMDAAQNHYGTFRLVSPMVFLDTHYWTEIKPVYPLCRALAEGRQYGELLGIADTADEVIAFLSEHAPVVYEK